MGDNPNMEEFHIHQTLQAEVLLEETVLEPQNQSNDQVNARKQLQYRSLNGDHHQSNGFKANLVRQGQEFSYLDLEALQLAKEEIAENRDIVQSNGAENSARKKEESIRQVNREEEEGYLILKDASGFDSIVEQVQDELPLLDGFIVDEVPHIIEEQVSKEDERKAHPKGNENLINMNEENGQLLQGSSKWQQELGFDEVNDNTHAHCNGEDNDEEEDNGEEDMNVNALKEEMKNDGLETKIDKKYGANLLNGSSSIRMLGQKDLRISRLANCHMCKRKNKYVYGCYKCWVPTSCNKLFCLDCLLNGLGINILAIIPQEDTWKCPYKQGTCQCRHCLGKKSDFVVPMIAKEEIDKLFGEQLVKKMKRTSSEVGVKEELKAKFHRLVEFNGQLIAKMNKNFVELTKDEVIFFNSLIHDNLKMLDSLASILQEKEHLLVENRLGSTESNK